MASILTQNQQSLFLSVTNDIQCKKTNTLIKVKKISIIFLRFLENINNGCKFLEMMKQKKLYCSTNLGL